MRYNKIVFYNDCYDNNILIWKAEKQYRIIGESKDLYICECEDIPSKSHNYGIEKNIKGMYYLI